MTNQRRQYFKEYRIRNRERRTEYMRAWRKLHPGAGEKQALAWRNANRVTIQAYQNEWRNRTGRIAFDNNRRRERKVAAGECDPTSANVLTQLIQSLPKMQCALCGINMKQGDRTIDHVIPLSKGGSGHIGNLQVVHRACNSRKRASLPHELDGQFQINFVGHMAA